MTGRFRGRGFSKEKPLPRTPTPRDGVGELWGGGGFSERSPSSPDPFSRRAAGVWVGCFCGVGSACELGAVPCGVVVVTAADRAAATCQRWVPTNYRKEASEGFQRAIAKPFGRARRHEISSASTDAAPPRTVAAALSAAVTTAKPIGDAPNSHGRASPKEASSLFPATLRERGSGGEALLLEKRPLPQSLPNVIFREGSAREGTFL